MWILTIIVVAVAAWLLVAAGRQPSYVTVAPTPKNDPVLRIARERLERGEIDPETYRGLVEILTRDRT